MPSPDDPVFSPFAEDALHDAAAAWLARRDSGFNAAQAAEFAQWREADPRHAAALQRAEAAQRLLARLPEAPGAGAMLAEVDALSCARPRIVPFSTVWKTAAVLAAAACIVAVFFLATPALDRANATYTTAAGHHRTVELPDGSTLVLNASTTVEVAFAPAERRVRLEHGEAHFYVAKDTARPFLVSAGTVTVRAVGTAFNVRRQVAAVEVLVTEGKVRVSRADASAAAAEAEPIFLVAGERAFIESVPAAALAAHEPAPAGAAAERSAPRAPRLMFNNTPLADVVDRFNHYNRVQMEIADPELAHRSVGGNFDADNAESFINLLSSAGDIRVERLSPHQVRLHKVP